MGVRNTVFYSIGFYLAKVCWLLSGIKIGSILFNEPLMAHSMTNGSIAGNYSISSALLVYASLIFMGIMLYYRAKLPEVKKGIAFSQLLLFLTVIMLVVWVATH